MKGIPYIVKIISIILLLFALKACVDPYFPKTDIYENVLVVDADLTNIFKKQKVVLTRTNRLETDTILTESKANVYIKDDSGHTYSFTESEKSGVYLSDEEFNAVPNIAYSLHITTKSGEEYESREEYLTPQNQITNVYAEMLTTNEGITGAQIYVDSDIDAIGDARYIRYKFEETYKIYTPNSINKTMEIVDETFNSYRVIFTTHVPPRPRTCYTTLTEKKIMQLDMEDLSSEGVVKYPVRFIPPEDLHMIKERYSILVKQYTQSKDAYNFYKTLNKFSRQESLLSDYQMGFVQGNLYATDKNHKIVGFFDVTSVSTKRIFFNYEDLFIDEPSYFHPCTSKTYDYRITLPSERDLILYYGRDLQPPWDVITYEIVGEAPYLSPIITFVNPECGDCSKFSNPIKPEFWED
jgi:hypothetical protein